MNLNEEKKKIIAGKGNVFSSKIVMQEDKRCINTEKCPFCTEWGRWTEDYTYKTKEMLPEYKKQYDSITNLEKSKNLIIKVLEARDAEGVNSMKEATKKTKRLYFTCETCGIEIDKGKKAKRTELMEFLAKKMKNYPKCYSRCATGHMRLRHTRLVQYICEYLKNNINSKKMLKGLIFKRIDLKKLLSMFESHYDRNYLKKMLTGSMDYLNQIYKNGIPESKESMLFRFHDEK